MTIRSRLEKLEGHSNVLRQIAIWCDEPDQVQDAIDDMVEAGELKHIDRDRCVHWTLAKGIGHHERGLEMLS